MTDHFTSLSLRALKEIVAHLDESISLIDRHKGRMTASEIHIKSMLSALRGQLLEHITDRDKDRP